MPTYGRNKVLIDTINHLKNLQCRPSEILVVDQTLEHDLATTQSLTNMEASGDIRWIRVERPSITRAMNLGLLHASSDVVLFLDDDVEPIGELVEAHGLAHQATSDSLTPHLLVAGRVLQPWHLDGSRSYDRLASTEPGIVPEFIGCNFSVNRRWAISLGGFDERFIRVAYRFEAEFGSRARHAGIGIHFEPSACIHHLKAEEGGTRSFGDHLRSITPSHTVGQYYYLLSTKPDGWMSAFAIGPIRAVLSRFHLKRPWWIPGMLIGQVLGQIWAIWLRFKGPLLISTERGGST